MYNNKKILLPDGTFIPKLGQGTWRLGENDSIRESEIRGLSHGIDLGIALLDTAEMYSDGKAELIVGQSIKNKNRNELYIVDKVYPKNANEKHMFSSCERSLKLLGTDYIDMYLLHWREDADLSEVVYCMEKLKKDGKILRWGVSNFDIEDMIDLWNVPNGDKCQINQVLYNLGSRGIEFDLCDWQRERNIPFMAYSPVGQAGDLITQDGVSKAQMISDKNVIDIAKEKGITVIQLLLAFVLRFDDMIAIPKAVSFKHIEENVLATNISFTEEEIIRLSMSFPLPKEKILMEKY